MNIKEKLCHVINRVAEAYRKEQSLRKSKLSIRDTIQILIGAEGGSLAKELHRAGCDVSASALSQRRAQIPAKAFRDIFMGFNGECVDSEAFHGFRLLAVDGTAVSIPRNPKSDSFVVHSGASKGYNQLHMTPLYDILNKVYLEAVIQPEPHKDEIDALIELVRRNKFKEKTLIIGDRGFESYNLLAHLTEKENLSRQGALLMKTYLKPSWYSRLLYFLETLHNCFRRFVVGQCTEAVILGLLCMGGMLLFQFPYASMVGTLIGFTALIPVAGAYIGAGVGAFMIFTVSPLKALLFLVFISVLQQLEGNLIYPKVVGSSIGLPGIWVLAAVTIGGGVLGIGGMLLAVPLAATFYQVLRDDVAKRNRPAPRTK